MSVTRLAPSPTGALHLGNARTFLINWLLARKNGWRIQLRIDDLDGPRIKRAADQQAIDDLRWLGLDWDEGPFYQSSRVLMYAAAVQKLLALGRAYPCVCSRKDIELAASAPHADDGATIYPGTCRGRFASMEAARSSTGRAPAVRFLTTGITRDAGVSPVRGGSTKPGDRVHTQASATGETPVSRTIAFADGFHDPVTIDVPNQLGDFVIAKADGTAAYQLATVVDDADFRVTHIVRGDDLLDSTPRQIQLYDALDLLDRVPKYFHLPLVVGPDGRRLAKRHGDTRLSFYRNLGVKPQRLLALLARWSGIVDTAAVAACELIERFDLSRLPKEPVVFTPQDDAWLRA